MSAIQIVSDFMARWSESREALHASFRGYFLPTTVWENVGLATTTGVDEALNLLANFEAQIGVVTIKVEMLNIANAGDVVLTERIDRLIRSDGTQLGAIRLMGILETEGRKIIRWRDYFDPAAVFSPAAGP
jgi:limonene-1,2-epoxide hydrolase